MSINKVIHGLYQLDEVHLLLLELSEQKKHVIIDNQVNELSHLVNKEKKLIKKVAEYEAQLLQEVTSYLEDKGYEPGLYMNVSDLRKIVTNAADKQSLMDAQSKLMKTIQQLKESNELNQQLIEQSLSFIDYTLDLLSGDPGQDMTYQNPVQNKGRESKVQRIFDTRA